MPSPTSERAGLHHAEHGGAGADDHQPFEAEMPDAGALRENAGERHIDERRARAEDGDDGVVHQAALRREREQAGETLRPGPCGDEERDRGVDDVDRRGRQAGQHRQVETGGGEPAEEDGDEGRRQHREVGDERDQDRREAVGRQHAADDSRPIGPSTSMVPASPASAPPMTKPARPRRESFAPCQTHHDRVAPGEAGQHAERGAVDQHPHRDADQDADDDDGRRQRIRARRSGRSRRPDGWRRPVPVPEGSLSGPEVT